MKSLDALSRIFDRINEAAGRLVSWVTLGMVVVTAYDTIMRYGFQKGNIALQELEWHLFGIVFLLGAGYTLKADAHVRVDIFYARLGERARAIVNLVGVFVALLPFCVLVIWCTRGFVENAWSIREFSPDPGGLPARYVMKAVIPLGFFLVALQGLSEAVKCVRVIRRKENGDA